MLRIRYRFRGRQRALYAKYEAMNMTGSIKDRMASHIMRHAYESGDLRPGDTIVEASSGNTGISFAAIGRALGHPVRIFMPDWMSNERRQLIHALGAEIVSVSHEDGGFLGAISLAREFSKEHSRAFLPQQFDSERNSESHETGTGPEIEHQLVAFGQRPDAFVAGVGTGGTVTGVGRFLRRLHPRVAIHPLEPANSPTLREGRCVGHHRIQGISDEFIPSIIHLEELDHIVDVWDGDAIIMAQALSRRLGLAVGISSGANFLGAVQLVEEYGADAVVVTVFPDSSKKYLSTDLLGEEPAKEGYLAPQVELERFQAVR